MRIKTHPILSFEKKEEIVFTFEGKQVVGQKEIQLHQH